MNIIKRLLSSLEARLSQPQLSIWRTVYFNFRTLPFSQAVKFPIFIYGKVKFFILSGGIEIKSPIYKGMVRIGMNTESFSLFDHSAFIQINKGSKLIFEGAAKIGVNCKIRLVGGDITLGKNVFLGTGVRLIANGSPIYIGQGSRIAFETVIMNSGFHYIYNQIKGGYPRSSNPILIGNYNWIGNRSTVASNTKTKPFSIICSGSLVNKDYTNLDGDYPMLGGQPAKMITCGMKRVFSHRAHSEIEKWFENNPNQTFFETMEIKDDVNDLDIEFK